MRITYSLVAIAALLAAPAMAGENVDYTAGEDAFEGYYAAPEGDHMGLVLVIHDWDGLTDYEKKRADMLAELGYAAFAADLYGAGVRPESMEGRKAEMGKLYEDRERMRNIILASLEKGQEMSDSEKAVVMGYCFGGSATLELARSQKSSAPVGYASFHGGLSTPEGQGYEGVETPILIMHGEADASVSMEDLAALEALLQEANVPHEVETYEGAPHAWTVFGSERYRPEADARSWETFKAFLKENL